MFRRLDPARLRQLRGRILSIAYLAAMSEAGNPDDPYTVSRGVLVGTLEHSGELPSSEDLRGALRVLEEKGALKVTWRHDGSGEFVTVRLQALGIDLVEGAVVDPGITFTLRREH